MRRVKRDVQLIDGVTRVYRALDCGVYILTRYRRIRRTCHSGCGGFTAQLDICFTTATTKHDTLIHSSQIQSFDGQLIPMQF